MRNDPIVLHLICAEKIIQDQNSKKNSYIDIFEKISIPKDLEYVTIPFCVGGRLSGVKAGMIEVRLTLLDPEKQEIWSGVASGPVPDETVNLNFRLEPIRFSKSGSYTFKISCNDIEVSDASRYSLDVRKSS